MGEVGLPPAFYARRGSAARDWWTVLHPPYTAWHLGYVVIGAALAPRIRLSTLLATLLAFFLAVGVAAHALDELEGRPLRTSIPSHTLVAVSVAALAGALAIGAVGVHRVGLGLIAFMAVGALLVVAYDLELFGGVVHTDAGFALAWGAFPVACSYFSQAGTLRWSCVLAAAAAAALSAAQRRLSTPARHLRRQRSADASPEAVAAALAPLEGALRAMTLGVVLLAAGMALARLT